MAPTYCVTATQNDKAEDGNFAKSDNCITEFCHTQLLKNTHSTQGFKIYRYQTSYGTRKPFTCNNGRPPEELEKVKAKTDIQAFFSGKKVFITGVTGFLGSVVLEKLLRSCSDIDSIYILTRPKRGQNVEARLENMLSSELFCGISPKMRNKIVAVEGDISHPGLGITAKMEETLTKEIQIVFHVAASTNFSSHLRQALNINFHGTRRVIELSEKMKNLQVFIHVSTAYCNAIIRGKIREVVYPSWIDGNELTEIISKMTDEEISEKTKDLLGGEPNTYAFTKHLSENYLYKKRWAVPVAVLRPSVVLGTWKEPVPGWVENVQNGGVAFIAGAGKGVFRTVVGDPTKTSDIVPCDMVSNMTIAAAWDVYTQGPGTFKVYHCTSGLDNPITLDSYCNLTIQKVIENPCKEVLWYPSAKCRQNLTRLSVFTTLYHLLPALILHVMERWNGRNRPIISYQQKFIRGMSYIYYFTKRDWHFEMQNAKSLTRKMSPEDAEIFDFDVMKIDWPSYIETCVLGVRYYYHRDSPKTLARARMSIKILKFLHYAAYALSFFAAHYFLSVIGFGLHSTLIGATVFLTFLIWL